MKRLFYFAGAALLLVGCQKDNLSEIKNAEEAGAKGGKVEVSASAGYGETKAALGEAEEGVMPINWEENDVIGVFFQSGFDKVNGVSIFPYDSLSQGVDFYDQLPDVNILRLTSGAGTKNGTFAGSLYPTPKKSDTYYAYYPFQHYVENPNGFLGRGTGYAFGTGSAIATFGNSPVPEGSFLVLDLPAEQDGKSVGFMTASDADASYTEGLKFQFKQLLPLLKLDIDPALVNDIETITYNVKSVNSKAAADYTIDLYQKSATDLTVNSKYDVVSAYWTPVQIKTAIANSVANYQAGPGKKDPKPEVVTYDFYGIFGLHFWRHSAVNGWEYYSYLQGKWVKLNGGSDEPEHPDDPTKLYAWALDEDLKIKADGTPATESNDLEAVTYITLPTGVAETYGTDYYLKGNDALLDNNYEWPLVEDSNVFETEWGVEAPKNVAGRFYTYFNQNVSSFFHSDFNANVISVNGDGSSVYTLVVPKASKYETPVVEAPKGVTEELGNLVAGEVVKTLKSVKYEYDGMNAAQLADFIGNNYVVYTATNVAPSLTINRTQSFTTVKPYENLTITREQYADGFQPTITVTLKDGSVKTYQIFDVALEGGKLYVKTVK